MLILLRVIMTSAFSSDSSKQIEQAVLLVRKSSSTQDEDKLEKTVSAGEKSDLASPSTISDNVLNQLMAEDYGIEILVNTDFSQLQAHLLSLVSQLIQRKTFTLEDKFIIENSMALWIGCVLH